MSDELFHGGSATAVPDLAATGWSSASSSPAPSIAGLQYDSSLDDFSLPEYYQDGPISLGNAAVPSHQRDVRLGRPAIPATPAPGAYAHPLQHPLHNRKPSFSPTHLLRFATHGQLMQAGNMTYLTAISERDTARAEMKGLRAAYDLLLARIGIAGISGGSAEGHARAGLIITQTEWPDRCAEDYPRVTFFTRNSWSQYLRAVKTEEGMNEVKPKRGKNADLTAVRVNMAYLQHEDGSPIVEEEARAICEAIRRIFNELRLHGHAPSHWKAASSTATKYLYQEMYRQWDFLRLCDNHWKIEYLASSIYSNWYRPFRAQGSDDSAPVNLVENGGGDDDDGGDDGQTGPVTNKRKQAPTSPKKPKPVRSKLTPEASTPQPDSGTASQSTGAADPFKAPEDTGRDASDLAVEKQRDGSESSTSNHSGAPGLVLNNPLSSVTRNMMKQAEDDRQKSSASATATGQQAPSTPATTPAVTTASTDPDPAPATQDVATTPPEGVSASSSAKHVEKPKNAFKFDKASMAQWNLFGFEFAPQQATWPTKSAVQDAYKKLPDEEKKPAYEFHPTVSGADRRLTLLFALASDGNRYVYQKPYDANACKPTVTLCVLTGPEGSEDLKARVIEGTLSPDSLRLIHPQTRDLILKCLERNPRIRLGLEQIKGHGFFTNVSWTKVADRLVEVPPFPGSFDKHMNRDSPPTRYSTAAAPPTLSTYPIDSIQLAPVEVQPLRIEKKASRSPIESSPAIAPSSSGLVSTNQGDGEEYGHGLSSPRSRTFLRLPRSSEGMRSMDVLPMGDDERTLAHRSGGPGIWDILDQEEQERAYSLRSGGAESRKRNVFSFFKSRSSKVPKGVTNAGSGGGNRSSTLYPRNLFLNFSTVSFGKKKVKSSSPTWTTVPPLPSIPSVLGGASTSSMQSNVELPLGLEQIGSGIGFQYNLTPVVPSKTSIISGAPRGCMFPSSKVVATSAEETVEVRMARRSRSGTGTTSGTVASSTARGLGLGCTAEREERGRRSQVGERPSRGTLRDVRQSPAPASQVRDTYHPGNSAAWIVPCLEDGASEPRLSPVVQAYLGRTSPLSATPESDGGPFTPTAIACEDDSNGFDDSCGVDGGTLEGKMEPDETLRLVRRPYQALDS